MPRGRYNPKQRGARRLVRCWYDAAMNELSPGRLARRLAARAAAALCVLLFATGVARAQGSVLEVELDGPLGVATAEYIISGIETANERNAALLIIRMDTPGGLVDPTRDIIKAILASDVPVATYVSPNGSRATSAGTYILLASHVAAMAPTTEMGAATPVSLAGGGESPQPPMPMKPGGPAPGGGEAPAEDGEQASDGDEAGERSGDGETAPQPGTAMDRKVINDAVSYIHSLAEAHGRNADWAERAVREAATLTASEALEQNVIDLIAYDRAELLEKIDGRTVTVNNREVTLETSGLMVERLEPSWRIKFLSAITNPQVALLLLLVGIYGLVFEGWNPGAIVPGVVGVVCLLLAAYALQVLPVNYAGLGLILIGLVLIIAEAFAPSFGALGLGGTAAFIFGAIMMFDSGIPGFGISIAFVVSLGIVAAGLLLWLVTYLVRLQDRGAVSGEESILKGTAVAMEDFTGAGKVWLEGETWQARSPAPVQKDQKLRVRSIDGLLLHVEPLETDGSMYEGSESNA